MWWHTVTHWRGNCRGNWHMEWVTSTLHTTSERGVSSITTADAHTSAASSRLNWRPPADLNGLVRFAERPILVSAHVPSRFRRPIPLSCVFFKLFRISQRQGARTHAHTDRHNVHKTVFTGWWKLPFVCRPSRYKQCTTSDLFYFA